MYTCFINWLQSVLTRYKLHSLVHLLQQLVTECTDQVPTTQPCTLASTTGYRVYRPGTSYTALYSCFYNWLQCTVQVPVTQLLYSLPHPSWLQSSDLVHSTRVDSGAGRQPVSTRYGFNRLVTESTDRPHSLLHINRLQSLPIANQHQESPTQRSSTRWPILISSQFTGLRLMTGLIMYSP